MKPLHSTCLLRMMFKYIFILESVVNYNCLLRKFPKYNLKSSLKKNLLMLDLIIMLSKNEMKD